MPLNTLFEPGVLMPNVTNVYVPGHTANTVENPVFDLPRNDDSAYQQRIIFKIMGRGSERVRVRRHPDDGGGPFWEGTTGGDYMDSYRFANWRLLDHHETIVVRYNKNDHFSIPAGSQRVVRSWHKVEDVCGCFDDGVLTVPYPARLTLLWNLVPGKVTSQSGLAAEVVANEQWLLEPNHQHIKQSSAHGYAFTPFCLLDFACNGFDWKFEIAARNLESDTAGIVDARSELHASIRWMF